MKATPKLSGTGKMSCKSWSLPAFDTCPGAVNKEGKVADACKTCYARKGMYRFPNTRKLREHNQADWHCADWVDAMAARLKGMKRFRWFDSGDVYSVGLAKKIYRVMKATSCEHWLPTRSYKFASISKELDRMEQLPNVTVRKSSDSVTGESIEGNHTSTIIQKAEDYTPGKGKVLCRAYTRNGKCGSCTACWSKKVHEVTYISH